MAFSLPALPYGARPNCAAAGVFPAACSSALVTAAVPVRPAEYGALQPHIDLETMTLHHTKHHQVRGRPPVRQRLIHGTATKIPATQSTVYHLT